MNFTAILADTLMITGFVFVWEFVKVKSMNVVAGLALGGGLMLAGF